MATKMIAVLILRILGSAFCHIEVVRRPLLALRAAIESSAAKQAWLRSFQDYLCKRGSANHQQLYAGTRNFPGGWCLKPGFRTFTPQCPVITAGRLSSLYLSILSKTALTSGLVLVGASTRI